MTPRNGWGAWDCRYFLLSPFFSTTPIHHNNHSLAWYDPNILAYLDRTIPDSVLQLPLFLCSRCRSSLGALSVPRRQPPFPIIGLSNIDWWYPNSKSVRGHMSDPVLVTDGLRTAFLSSWTKKVNVRSRDRLSINESTPRPGATPDEHRTSVE